MSLSATLNPRVVTAPAAYRRSTASIKLGPSPESSTASSLIATRRGITTTVFRNVVLRTHAGNGIVVLRPRHEVARVGTWVGSRLHGEGAAGMSRRVPGHPLEIQAGDGESSPSSARSPPTQPRESHVEGRVGRLWSRRGLGGAGLGAWPGNRGAIPTMSSSLTSTPGGITCWACFR